jgi:hypothetical protein
VLNLAAALLLACGGLMTDTALAQTRLHPPEGRAANPGELQASASGRQPASIDGEFERNLLKETHGHGTLIDVRTGAADKPTTIFVHGIPGAASSLTGVIQKAIDAGGTVKAFAYDNKFRSMEDSSRDLASSIETWMDDNPGRPLRSATRTRCSSTRRRNTVISSRSFTRR